MVRAYCAYLVMGFNEIYVVSFIKGIGDNNILVELLCIVFPRAFLETIVTSGCLNPHRMIMSYEQQRSKHS